MAVEDLQPLTKPDHGDEKEEEPGGGGGGGSRETLDTLLTSALHKHAAKKLGKKMTKNKKDEVKTDGDTGQEKDKSKYRKKKKKTSKLSKKKDTQDVVELQVVSEAKLKGEGKDKGQACLQRQKDNDADQKKNLSMREEEVIEDNGTELENGAHPCDPSTSSPTGDYLKTESVPKKKSTKKSKKTEQVADKVLGITIHFADRFEGSPLLFPHPVVQVHISNSETGQLLKKSTKDRKATSFYEGSEVDYILPMMTQPYDIKKARSLQCKWEEQLIINELVDHFSSDDHQVVIFFQLMDFPSMSASNSNAPTNQLWDSVSHEWVTFAWAFLKIKGANNHLNIGHQLRLQLWKPRKSSKVNLKDLHSWWKSGSRNKYPSTLYVTLQEIFMPQNPRSALRSMLATQQEQGGGTALMDLLDLSSTDGSSQSLSTRLKKPVVNWGRKPNQSCKIPNSVKHCFSHTDKGCMVVKFSNDGLRLSCGAHKLILLYDVLKGQLEHTLLGHLGLIYDISWSDNDRLLLTASADSTARIWHIDSKNGYDQACVLAHPSYVYAARFVPTKSHIFISGCYDHVVRVWSSNKTGGYSIVQELTDHLSFVNTLCFNLEGNVLFSGDKQGVILMWNVDVQKKEKGKKKSKILTLKQVAKISDIVGNIINSISYHPGGFRLLVHTRDSQLRLVNHKHWTVTHRLRGFLNIREQVRGCLSPCGSWVISGSEDNGLYVWNSDTGEIVSEFLDLPIDGTISCVDFHPHDHMMAVCSYSSEAPVVILVYNQEKLPANTTIPMYVQPAVSRSPDISMIRSPSPSHLPQEHSLSSDHKEQSHVTKHLSSPVRSEFHVQEQRQSELRTVTSSQSVTEIDRKSFTFKNQYSGNSDQGVNKKGLWYFHGDKILKKLDSVLKMATEDPLNISSNITSGKRGEEVFPLGQLATVLYDYQSTEPDELTVKQGDYVMVVQEMNEDWWLVRTADLKFTGIVPSAYLQQLPGGYSHEDETDSGKIIAVPSGSGEVSFISDVEGTPSKARARRHKARVQSVKMITSTPKTK